MKVYSSHRCEQQHLDERQLLACAIPGARWITGRGHYALIAWCGRPTITLHTTITAALATSENLNPCGSRCAGRARHEVVRVDLTGSAEPAAAPAPRPSTTVTNPAGCCAHGVTLGGRCRKPGCAGIASPTPTEGATR